MCHTLLSSSMKALPRFSSLHSFFADLLSCTAHHLYRDKRYRDEIEKHASRDSAQRLLLSDVSQSHGRGICWPDGLTSVRLTEVVRCSQRIVAGAMAFQLDSVDGKDKKQDTMSQHKATGPPLKSFLFDMQPDEDRIKMYVEKTLKAMRYVFNEVQF